MSTNRWSIPSRLLAALVLVGIPGAALALEVKQQVTPLEEREFFKPDLYISSANVPADVESLRQSGGAGWQRFFAEHGTDFSVYLDPRSGTPSNVAGHVPIVPGTGDGNELTLQDLENRLGRPVREVEPKDVEDLVRDFAADNRDAFGIDVQQLGSGRATKVADHLWHVSIQQEVDGVPVRHGRLAATINHGNLVLLGTETWGNAVVNTEPSIAAAQAVDLGFAYTGGQGPQDLIWKEPELEIIPYAPAEHQTGGAFTGPIGQGYRHRLVWTFGFQRPPELAAWEVLVDAHTGEVLALEDTNQYDIEQVTGGVYPLTSTGVCPTNETCGTMQQGYPMPFANTGLPAPNNFTNSAGLFDYSGGTVTTTLNGRHVRVLDSCGAVSESSGTGSIDLGGFNNQHDCTSSGTSAGDTPSSRSCFYEVNKLMEMARGWLPNNTWLQGQMTANVNINQTCNAFYSTGSGTINFYRSGGGCRNTGEIAAVFDHEWGHALDDNDTGGSLSSSSEAYADIAAIYRLQASCVGHGFISTQNDGCGQTADGAGFNQNESQTGSHCDTDCSGVRDADWAKHADGVPDTPQNFNCVHCNSGPGPCGKQVHCSAAPSRQAAWDFVSRDLRGVPFSYDSNYAFIVGNKLFYQGSGNIGSWHACSCPNTSDGCGATHAYMNWLAADDDNGNLNDGTPHMTALYNAFNRHNIACATPAPTNSGCAGGPTNAPSLSINTGSNELSLQWTPVAGASSYRVLRTEGHAGCDFGKAVIATVTGTSYSDPAVVNDRDYGYLIQAVGASPACFGPPSTCELAVPQPCVGSISFDRNIYNCSDMVNIVLVDADLAGSGTHQVSISSGTEATPEMVTLTESPAGSGRFTGAVATSSAAALTGDGQLSVDDGDTIVVNYLDISSCGTPNVTVERDRPVDCSLPSIFGVQAVNVTGRSADILWGTNEISTSDVRYDTVQPPVASTQSASTLVVNHAMHLANLAECTTYYFSVSSTDAAVNTATADNGGEYFVFETETDVNPSFPSSGPTVPIPDNNPTGATALITVADDGTIVDVNVLVNISHNNDGDLILSLIGPDGTTVILSNRRGGTGNNYTNTVFDDEAAIPIIGGSPPFSGSYRPDQALTAFDGKEVTGNWTLKAVDAAGGTSGTINSWRLTFLYPSVACGPRLSYLAHNVADACMGSGSGGGNAAAEAGEQIELPVTLKNDGIGAITGITARLTTQAPGVTILQETSAYPDLLPGDSAANPSTPFTFVVDANEPCRAAIEFSVEASGNEGAWTDTFSVLAGTPTFNTANHDSLQVPVDVPDNGLANSTLAVSTAATVTDVNVLIDLGHENAADMDIFLIGPNGLRVELTTDNGGANDDYDGTIFDDEAATPITSGTAPFAGSYRPEGILATLDGLPANGTWTLEIRDDAVNNVGKLRAWAIILTTPGGPVCAGCSMAAPSSEVQTLQWTAGSTSSLEWTSVPNADFYNLYRGVPADLPALLDSGPDSCLRETTQTLSTGEILTELPSLDSFFWYLVRAGNAGGLGPAGAGTAGPRVQNSSGSCP